MPNVGDVLLEFGKREGAIVAGAFFKVNVVTGGVAGDHTISGIIVGDVLVTVLRFIGGGADVTDVTDITSEFTVAAGKLTNVGGTNTTGDKLLVVWIDAT